MKLSKLFTKIIIGIGLIGLISFSPAIIEPIVKNIHWSYSNTYETKKTFWLNAGSLSGDSVVFYKGQPAILKGISIRSVLKGTAYTDASANDTVKVKALLGSTVVDLAIINDNVFTLNSEVISYSPMATGTVTGTNYFLTVPTGKFTGGNNVYVVIADLEIYK